MVIAAKKPPPIAPPDISHVAATDGAQPSATVTAKSRAAARPKRTGSLGLFFRKVPTAKHGGTGGRGDGGWREGAREGGREGERGRGGGREGERAR